MTRVRNLERLEKIYRYVEEHPGTNQWDVALSLGLVKYNISGYLASMESVGMYLSEDDEGRLYPFRYCPGNVLKLFSGPV